MRAITYARVSTGRQADSGLSLDDQADQTATAIAHRGWQLVGRYIDTASGGSMLGRPQLAAALDRLARGEADALVVAKLDRLARSSLDFATLLARAHRERWSLVVLDLDVDTSTPTGELVASIVGAVAQYERRLIADRVSMTHAQRRRRGLRAGSPPRLDPELRHSIAARVTHGESLHSIARSLNEAETPTAQGGRWWPSTVAHVARSVALDVDLDRLASLAAARSVAHVALTGEAVSA